MKILKREEFLIKLISLGNLPYIWGGEGPWGYDCSGLAQYIMGLLELDPKDDQSADDLKNYFTKNGSNIYLIGNDKPDLGDLVFYGSVLKASHIAVCLNSEMMIEAGGGDHTCITKERALALDAKVKVTRIDHRKDLLVIIRPNGIPWDRRIIVNGDK